MTNAAPVATDVKALSLLIVDDEKKARTLLRNIITSYADLPIGEIAEAHNTLSAEQQIVRQMPDAVFLDIEMPNENAFSFLARTPHPFEIIFVTAYDEYAVRAFKLNALDYILKPVSITEVKSALGKLREKLAYKDHLKTTSCSSYSDLAKQVNRKEQPLKITLRNKNCVEVVDFRDVMYIRADGSYSCVCYMKGNETKEVTMSWLLNDYEDVLPGDQFFRIHRSYIVNCTRITAISNENGGYAVLSNHHKLEISRRNYIPLINFLKGHRFVNV